MKYKLNLQFFAEEETTETAPVEDKTYNAKEVEELIATRLEEVYAKFEEEKKEIKRLASMSAEERLAEKNKKVIKQLEERESEIAKAENLALAKSLLAEKRLPLHFATFVTGESEEQVNNNVEILYKAVNESVRKEIDIAIRGKTPSGSCLGSRNTGITKKQWKELPLLKKNELYKKNKNILRELG